MSTRSEREASEEASARRLFAGLNIGMLVTFAAMYQMFFRLPQQEAQQQAQADIPIIAKVNAAPAEEQFTSVKRELVNVYCPSQTDKASGQPYSPDPTTAPNAVEFKKQFGQYNCSFYIRHYNP